MAGSHGRRRRCHGGLAHAAGAAHHHDFLGRQQGLDGAGAVFAPAQLFELRSQGGRDLASRAQTVGAQEQIGHIEQARRSGARAGLPHRVSQALQMSRARPAHLYHEAGRIEQRLGRAAERFGEIFT